MTDFSMEDSNSKSEIVRDTITDIINAFAKLDECFGLKPSEMLVAYRTIKIGQEVMKHDWSQLIQPVLRRDGNPWAQKCSEVIGVVLQDFPLGKPL